MIEARNSDSVKYNLTMFNKNVDKTFFKSHENDKQLKSLPQYIFTEKLPTRSDVQINNCNMSNLTFPIDPSN